MTRFFSCLLTVLLIMSSQAHAADNGGFGSGFTNKAPSALMETPTSTLAQTVPDATQVQNIMPAAGDEATDGNPLASQPVEAKTQGIVETRPTTVHDSVESHVTVPAGISR